MNILYCGDQGIKDGLLVSILSLLINGQKHNPLAQNLNPSAKNLNPANNREEKNHHIKNPNYNIYIATINYQDVTPFQGHTAKFLDQLVKKYNPKSSVTLVDATDVFTKNLPAKNMGSYFTPCSMLRLYIDKIPEINHLDRILYLDYDVVCRADFSDFYHTDMTHIEAAGVLDIYGKHFYHYHGLKQDYMNSGVMLFNIPECIKTHMFPRTVELCARRWMMLADQAALNKSITRRKLMPRRYNEQAERPKPDTVFHHFSNNFKFWPVFHVQKVKPHEIDKIHRILKITEYDDILKEYETQRKHL